MKCISKYFVLIAALPLLIAFCAEPGATAEDKATTLKGVWKIEATEIVNGSDVKTTVPHAQEDFAIQNPAKSLPTQRETQNACFHLIYQYPHISCA
jgi:hypothetical protein